MYVDLLSSNLDVKFGELTNGGLGFQQLDISLFLYPPLTLACGGEENDEIVWKFSENPDLSSHVDLNATYSDIKTGLSWLDVDSTKQGYYQCQIGNSSSYRVGVYDNTVTKGENLPFQFYTSLARFACFETLFLR